MYLIVHIRASRLPSLSSKVTVSHCFLYRGILLRRLLLSEVTTHTVSILTCWKEELLFLCRTLCLSLLILFHCSMHVQRSTSITLSGIFHAGALVQCFCDVPAVVAVLRLSVGAGCKPLVLIVMSQIGARSIGDSPLNVAISYASITGYVFHLCIPDQFHRRRLLSLKFVVLTCNSHEPIIIVSSFFSLRSVFDLGC